MKYGELNAEFGAGKGYLHVHCRGNARLCDFFDLVDSVAAQTTAHSTRRVLLDLRDVTQTLHYSEHLELGRRVADRLRFAERAASVVGSQYRNGSSEKAAQQSGLAFRTFTELGEAISWLTAEPDQAQA